MAIVPVEILRINNLNSGLIKNAIKIINSRQQGFRFEEVDYKTKKTDWFNEKQIVHADEVYSHIEDFVTTMKGFHPHLIGVTDKILVGFVDNMLLSNLFCTVEKKNGELTGKGVVTTYEVDSILPNTPIEIYLIFYFLSASIRFLSNRILIHEESRDCPFDLKMSKLDLRKIIRKGRICKSCFSRIEEYLNISQLHDINNLLNLTSQISNSSNPQKHLEELLSITGVYEIQKEGNNELVKEIIEDRIDQQSHSTISGNKNEALVEIKKMIGRGKIKSAIEEVLNFLDTSSNYFNETILLYARFSQINTDFRKGLINGESKTLEFNRINDSFLQIIDEI